MSSVALRDRLGHAFHRPELFLQALTHRSYGATHNERLEFIGDAVLNCVVAAVLYERFPAIPEGDLSRVRANLVNRDTLALLARRLDLGAEIRLGEGELRSGGDQRPSLLADTLEALFGAVFLDAGYDAARAVIERVYAVEFEGLDPAALGKDPKTRLQEWLQARRLAVPTMPSPRWPARRMRRRSPSSAAFPRSGSSPRQRPEPPGSRAACRGRGLCQRERGRGGLARCLTTRRDRISVRGRLPSSGDRTSASRRC